MNAALAEVVQALQGPIRRIEAMAQESRNELREAKKERELRAQWDREQRERENLEAMRARTKSETDLAQALQRPPTPLVAFVPPPEDSEPELPKSKRYSRAVTVAIISGVVTVLVAAIGAWASQRSAPHGFVEPKPVHEEKP